MIPDLYLGILSAIVTFVVISFLYKENHLFSFVEGIAIGFAVGNTLIILLTRSYDQIVTPLSQGNLEKLIPLIFGLLLFTFFTPKYRNVYRAVLMGYILIIYGVTFGFGIQTVLQRFISWGEILTIGGVATIIVATTSLLYLIYSKRLSGATKYPGYLGYFFIIWMFGWMIGTFQVKHTVGLVQIFQTIVSGPGVYIMLIAILALLIDIFVGWRKILRLGPSDQS